MRMPVSPDLILTEMVGAKEILDKWIAAYEKGEVPGMMPSTDQAAEDFMRELCGELMLAASKCHNLAEILSS
jgi:hypothetical protein